MAKVNSRLRDLMCLFCKRRKVPPGRYYYCSTKCCNKAAQKRWAAKTGYSPVFARRSRDDRTKARGRVCEWCQARDDEVLFTQAGECETCATQARRYGKCTGHKRLKLSTGCPECKPPPNTLRVLLLDGSSDRKRYIWRSVKRGMVRLRKKYRVIERLPCEFVLSTPEYILTRH